MWAIGGIAAQLGGIALWRFGRGSGDRPGRATFAAGLGLLALSIILFTQGLGGAIGWSWALATVSLAALGLILYPMLAADRIGRDRVRTRPPARDEREGTRIGLALRLFAAGPLYLLAAMAIGAVVATKLPWHEVNRLMTGGLLIPALWSLGALHATVDLKAWRVLAVSIGLILVGGALFLWL